MPVFPSVEWFNAIKDIVNSDPAFRQLGTVDAVVGVKVGSKIFELTFEAFECTDVREAAENDLRDMDFWLEQSVRPVEGHDREHQEATARPTCRTR